MIIILYQRTIATTETNNWDNRSYFFFYYIRFCDTVYVDELLSTIKYYQPL